MDYKKEAKESIEKTRELISEIEIFKNSGKLLLEKIIFTYAAEISKCDNENDFINFMASLGDEIYKGNIIVEALDEIIMKKVLKLLDKILLDRFFGDDWFDKIKNKALDYIGKTNI